MSCLEFDNVKFNKASFISHKEIKNTSNFFLIFNIDNATGDTILKVNRSPEYSYYDSSRSIGYFSLPLVKIFQMAQALRNINVSKVQKLECKFFSIPVNVDTELVKVSCKQAVENKLLEKMKLEITPEEVMISFFLNPLVDEKKLPLYLKITFSHESASFVGNYTIEYLRSNISAHRIIEAQRALITK